MSYRYSPGHVSIMRIAIQQAIQDIPKRYQPLAKYFLLEGILRANWETGYSENTQVLTRLERGQFFMGYAEIAEVLGTTVKRIRKILALLNEMGKTASSGTNRGTTVTIKDFDTYSPPYNEQGKRKGKQRAAKGQSKGNSKQEKKEKNSNIPPPQFSPDFDEERSGGVSLVFWCLKFSHKPSDPERTRLNTYFNFDGEEKTWIGPNNLAVKEVWEDFQQFDGVEAYKIEDGKRMQPSLG